jgi:putative Mn2+ efflux pump MntP
MLFIGGIIAIVVFTIQVYKTAQGTERNGPLWAALTAAIGIAFQFVIPIFLGIVLAVYYMATGSPVESLERDIQLPSTIIGVVCIILSIVGMVLVSKHVSKVIDVPVGSSDAPPPPPTF